MGALLRFAPAPCTSVPGKTAIAPAGITSGTGSGICSLGMRPVRNASSSAAPQVCVPGSTTVAPFSAVKASTAPITLTANAGRGRGTR